MNRFDPLCTGFSPAVGLSRRAWLKQFGMGLGGMALADLLVPGTATAAAGNGILNAPHFAPKARRIIYLFQSGGPSQMDLFDYKPTLNQLHGTQLPDEVRKGQRLTGMSGHQTSLPLAGSPFTFSQHGDSGAWISELLPHTARIADELCFIPSMHTEAINHGPAITFMQTGSQVAGRPSFGAWLSYGLGSINRNLPSFVVLITRNKGGQPLVSRLWGSGFLASRHQGVRFRSGPDPVLYLSNPPGVTGENRKHMLDRLRDLHLERLEQVDDPALEARISEYELAFRMQTSIPEVTDLTTEPDSTFDLYGPDAKTPGTFAANCLLARRLAERNVRFIQLYHQGWDQHDNLPNGIRVQCRETDQASAALITDLKRRGLLDDTLVVWGGEFGRTNYCQGKLTDNSFGRDHHPRCFTLWMAGGGIKPGLTFGKTDELSYNIAEHPVHVHDLNATLLHQLGIDHKHLTHKFQGRRFRLTDVHGTVIKDILA